MTMENVTVRMPPEFIEALRKEAESLRLTYSELVRSILIDWWLENLEEEQEDGDNCFFCSKPDCNNECIEEKDDANTG